MSKIKTINQCEVCGSDKLIPVLDLGQHPLCDDLIPVSETGLINEEFKIEILHCDNCNTSHQKYQVEKTILFPIQYHYRSRFTGDVVAGMHNLVKSCGDVYGDLTGAKVLDIGCNDGTLLQIFKDQGATTIGVEPTSAVLESKSIDKYFNTYFDASTADEIEKSFGKMDIITFTNVFAHIEDLNGLIFSLKKLINDNTLLVIENHYLGSIFAKNQFDTFYHEHPRTYSLTSFKFIADKLEMKIAKAEFPSRYGGNIRVTMRRKTATVDADVERIMKDEAGKSLDLYRKMNEFISSWRQTKTKQLELLSQKGKEKLYCKAFPGRSAILVKMLGLDEKTILKTFEKPGSAKIGYCIPGTKIPIASDLDLFSMNPQPKCIINLAWHISSEIHDYLRKNGYQGEIIDIMP